MTALFSLRAEGPVATITLDRPERHNVITAADLPTLDESLSQIEGEAGLRVLVLTGAGDKTFCSGFDIGAIGDTDWSENPLDRALDRLEDLPIPTICALNGGVYGGGADLALACDFRIGVRPARLGVHYHIGGLRRFVQRLGLGPAKRLLMAAETFDDATLLEIGYLDHLVTREELAARTAGLADEIAALAPLALRGMKQSLNRIARGSLDPKAAHAVMLACLRSADFAEGAAAYAEKRTPRFTGN
jgi:enoyl-CoA hydratase/carnithine racemase